MEGSNKVPERLINYRVYNESNAVLGIATVDLPEIQAMSDTVSGAGIAGEVDSPVLGHFQAMSATFNWRTIEKPAMDLAKQQAHHLEIRGSQQQFRTAEGKLASSPVRVVMRAIPKNFSLGTFEPGSTTDSSTEFEVIYIKVFVDDKEVLEVDKYNFIAKFGDTDMLESVRKDLGLA